MSGQTNLTLIDYEALLLWAFPAPDSTLSYSVNWAINCKSETKK